MQQQLESYLRNCENDPIHMIGQVQDFGLFLTLTQDTLRVVQAGNNSREVIGRAADELIDAPIAELGLAGLAEQTEHLCSESAPSQAPTPTVAINGAPYMLSLHPWRNYLLLELEPQLVDERDPRLHNSWGSVNRALLQAEDYQTLLTNAAQQVQDITGYDRVMIYRFHEDWHGEVVAEAYNGKMGPPYLGLHYPATDIPQRARDLFAVNPIRIIENVYSTPISLYPSRPPGENATDLTYSVLRSASPVHIQYLKNMGVGASMTLSIMVEGKLWGMIACHHSSPRLVDLKIRQVCERISELFSSALQMHQLRAKNVRIRRSSDVGRTLARQLLVEETSISNALTAHEPNLLDLVDCAGAAVCVGNSLTTLGTTPSDDDLHKLVQWLAEHQREDIFVTEHLCAHYPGASAMKETAAGLISLALSQEAGDFVLWFKPEVVQTVYWGGDPEHPAEVSHSPEGLQISPRKSFAKWAQTMTECSAPWRDADIGAISRLRDDVLHVMIKRADQIRRLNDELKQAYARLDTFSYTVSHDLRTPLNAVRVYSEILLDEVQPENSPVQHQAATKIANNADRMTDLINAVLDYSRADKIATRFEPVDVRHLVSPIIDDLKTGNQGRELDIEVGALPPLYGDQTMVTQVFSNLLSNAVKYSSQKDKAVVRVAGETRKDSVVYAIEDNGIGIDMAEADKAFELFSRLTTDSSYEGHGVGLNIVKKIVDRHGGDIWIESSPGAGSTFFVAFPSETQGTAAHR